MARRMTIKFEGVGEAMRLPGVRGALTTRARAIAGRATAMFNAPEGPHAVIRGGSVRIETGTNGSGRPYSRVLHDSPDAEFGTRKTARRRVLGRAGEQRS